MGARRLLLFGLFVTLALGRPGAAHAGVPVTPGMGFHLGGIVPPIRAEVGGSMMTGPAGTFSTLDAAFGLNWSTIWPRATPIDLGVGFGVSVAGRPEPAPGAPSPGGGPQADDDGTYSSGGYVEMGVRLVGGKRWRVWLAGRGQLGATEAAGRVRSAVAANARVTAELFRGEAKAAKGLLVVGTAALGVYVEAKHRVVAGDVGGSSGVGVGLAVSGPLFAFAI